VGSATAVVADPETTVGTAAAEAAVEIAAAVAVVEVAAVAVEAVAAVEIVVAAVVAAGDVVVVAAAAVVEVDLAAAAVAAVVAASTAVDSGTAEALDSLAAGNPEPLLGTQAPRCVSGAFRARRVEYQSKSSSSASRIGWCPTEEHRCRRWRAAERD